MPQPRRWQWQDARSSWESSLWVLLVIAASGPIAVLFGDCSVATDQYLAGKAGKNRSRGNQPHGPGLWLFDPGHFDQPSLVIHLLSSGLYRLAHFRQVHRNACRSLGPLGRSGRQSRAVKFIQRSDFLAKGTEPHDLGAWLFYCKTANETQRDAADGLTPRAPPVSVTCGQFLGAVTLVRRGVTCCQWAVSSVLLGLQSRLIVNMSESIHDKPTPTKMKAPRRNLFHPRILAAISRAIAFCTLEEFRAGRTP